MSMPAADQRYPWRSGAEQRPGPLAQLLEAQQEAEQPLEAPDPWLRSGIAGLSAHCQWTLLDIAEGICSDSASPIL